MATLDEILALFPDNATGDISAADVRTAITALWDNDTHLDARVGALEAGGSGGDSFSVTGVWQVNPTPNGTPGGAQVASNATTFATATALKFNRFDKNNQEATASLLNATDIFMQMKQNSANWVTYDVSGTPTTDGTTITVPVTVNGYSGTTGAAAWQDAAVVINVQTSGGLGG